MSRHHRLGAPAITRTHTRHRRTGRKPINSIRDVYKRLLFINYALQFNSIRFDLIRETLTEPIRGRLRGGWALRLPRRIGRRGAVRRPRL
eukprot:6398658-Pyramimonas_sp.AAC.3